MPHKTTKGGGEFMFKTKEDLAAGSPGGAAPRTFEKKFGSTKKINRKLALLKKNLKKNL